MMYKIQANASGTRYIEVSNTHFETLQKYSLLSNLVGSTGIIDETILDKFKRLELVKQEEIIQEIIRGSPHPNLKEIRKNAPNIFLNLIHREIEEKMKGLNYGINSD